MIRDFKLLSVRVKFYENYFNSPSHYRYKWNWELEAKYGNNVMLLIDKALDEIQTSIVEDMDPKEEDFESALRFMTGYKIYEYLGENFSIRNVSGGVDVIAGYLYDNKVRLVKTRRSFPTCPVFGVFYGIHWTDLYSYRFFIEDLVHKAPGGFDAAVRFLNVDDHNRDLRNCDISNRIPENLPIAGFFNKLIATLSFEVDSSKGLKTYAALALAKENVPLKRKISEDLLKFLEETRVFLRPETVSSMIEQREAILRVR